MLHEAQGWIGDITIDEVQLGFEITSSSGGMDFTMNDYSVEYSTASTAVPADPTGLSADVAGPDSISLSWTDNATNETGYRIERSLTSGTGFTEIATVGANVSSYTDTGLTTGTTYYYRVQAYNAGGTSGYSNEASAAPQQLGSGTGLTGSYFNKPDLTGLVFTRTDATINFNWGNASPDPAIGADKFSLRWTGYILPFYSETYTFKTFSDDGDRVWINGQLIIDDWKIQRGGKTTSGSIALTAGQLYPITVEFYENTGGAEMSLYWSSPSQGGQIIPQSQLFAQ